MISRSAADPLVSQSVRLATCRSVKSGRKFRLGTTPGKHELARRVRPCFRCRHRHYHGADGGGSGGGGGTLGISSPLQIPTDAMAGGEKSCEGRERSPSLPVINSPSPPPPRARAAPLVPFSPMGFSGPRSISSGFRRRLRRLRRRTSTSVTIDIALFLRRNTANFREGLSDRVSE